MKERLGRRKFLKEASKYTLRTGAVLAGVYALDRLIKKAEEKNDAACELRFNAFVPRNEPQLEFIWFKNSDYFGDKVIWYQPIVLVGCSLEEIKARQKERLIEAVFQPREEALLVWVKRFEAKPGEVPYKDRRLFPFYTRPGDSKSLLAGVWMKKKDLDNY